MQSNKMLGMAPLYNANVRKQNENKASLGSRKLAWLWKLEPWLRGVSIVGLIVLIYSLVTSNKAALFSSGAVMLVFGALHILVDQILAVDHLAAVAASPQKPDDEVS